MKRRKEWESTTATNNLERQQQVREQKITLTNKNKISEHHKKQSERAAMLGVKEEVRNGGEEEARARETGVDERRI